MDDKQEQRYEPEQSGMYELEFPAPQLTASDGRGPVMIHALEGFSDAGHAIRLSAQHLKNTLDTELVASFAIDELLDYRSRRPPMTFKTDHFTHYEEPELSLYALHDSVGTPFCCSRAWSRICAGSASSRRSGCWPSGSGSARPSGWAPSRWRCRTRRDDADRPRQQQGADRRSHAVGGRVQVPGSVSNLLEYRMAQHGHDVSGSPCTSALPRPDRLSVRRRGAAHPVAKSARCSFR
jgi:hypothetical protein